MVEYLGFVDYIGRTNDGKYIYRFDFTLDRDTIWGEYFNIAPSSIIPDLQADKNSISAECKVNFPCEMQIAKKSYCFSMQDCIDGIIPLIFSDLSENTLMEDSKPFFIMFGEEFDDVEKKIKEAGLEIYDFNEVSNIDESALDDLMDYIDRVNKGQTNDF